MAGKIEIKNSGGKVLTLIHENIYGSDETIDVIKTKDDLHAHTTDTSNPHGVTKAQVGLDKVDNTADVDKSVKDSTQLGSVDADKYSQLAADETVSGSKTWLSDTLLMTNLPTSDPAVTGQLWNNSGALTVSAG